MLDIDLQDSFDRQFHSNIGHNYMKYKLHLKYYLEEKSYQQDKLDKC
jgi:hypothetical protein